MRIASRYPQAALLVFALVATTIMVRSGTFRASLFVDVPVSAPAFGIYISQGYQAQPNERGSVVVQAAEVLANVEGISFTFTVDSSRADIVRVRRTAITEQFNMSLHYPTSGVVHVALAGDPRTIAAGADILEIEIDLDPSTINPSGAQIPLAILGAQYLVNGSELRTTAAGGMITITGSQDALELPFIAHISDIDPGIYPLVQGKTVRIHGKGFPSNPRVFLGSRSLPIRSATSTSIVAQLPEGTLPGVYDLAVDALLAQEQLVVVSAPTLLDIVDELLFIDPNPVLYNESTRQSANLTLWVPVFNPLGSDDPITGTVDFSNLGGAPNIGFGRIDPTVSDADCVEDADCIGTISLGANGTPINWFSLPLTLSRTLSVDESYPITVRAQNRTGGVDTKVVDLQLVSRIGPDPVVPTTGPPVFSGRRSASPQTVQPGGTVEFFAGVFDPEGTDTITQVTLDLVDIGGTVIEMGQTVDPVSGSTQPVVYRAEFTVPLTVVPGEYSVRLEAFDDTGANAVELIPITIATVSQVGSVPRIVRTLATPSNVPANAKEKVVFSVEVEDIDGIKDIEVVRVDLAPLDLPFEFLRLDSKSTGGASKRGVFTSAKVEVPTSVRTGGYDLKVRVEDAQGNLTEGKVRLTVGTLGGDAPSVRETRFVPPVARPGGKARLFIEVEDENGIDTVTTIADFTDLRLGVEELDDLISYRSGTVATQNTFASDTLRIPDDLPGGVYDVPITVVDDTGNTIRSSGRLRIERGGEDQGSEPRIAVERAFQTPRVIPNDDSGRGEIHVLVHDADDDVLTVIANFGSIGRAKSASIRNAGDFNLLCGSSSAIVCMEPGVPEGTASRWFVLKDISIPKTTLASTEPYEITLTAIDQRGHTAEGRVFVQVGAEGIAKTLTVSPELLSIVPVNNQELELMVNVPVAAASVDRSGSQFSIRPTLDAFSGVEVSRVGWDTTGRFLYLRTEGLKPLETYQFTVGGGQQPLTDVYGSRFSKDNGGTLTFTMPSLPGGAPQISRIEVIDAEHIAVMFASSVLPSSVHPDLIRARTELQSLVTDQRFAVREATLQNNADSLLLTVDELRIGDRVQVTIPGVRTPGPVTAPPPGVQADFVVTLPNKDHKECSLHLPTADLNGDGRVDFSDFSLFSSVYGTRYDLAGACAQENASQGSQQHNSAPPRSTFLSNPIGEHENPLGGELPQLEF